MRRRRGCCFASRAGGVQAAARFRPAVRQGGLDDEARARAMDADISEADKAAAACCTRHGSQTKAVALLLPRLTHPVIWESEASCRTAGSVNIPGREAVCRGSAKAFGRDQCVSHLCSG